MTSNLNALRHVTSEHNENKLLGLEGEQSMNVYETFLHKYEKLLTDNDTNI